METTLFPLATLPPCASACGHLYDANGACVPPAKPSASASVYDSCFCNDARLTPFTAGVSGVCDNACADPNGLSSIRNWYTSFCSPYLNQADVNTNTDSTNTVSTNSAGTTGSASTVGGSSGGGGTWLSSHWQWIVMLVILIVAITGIWIGACIWRRHYLRRKDRQYALGKTLAAATRSGTNPYGGGSVGAAGARSSRSVHLPRQGLFQSANISEAAITTEKPMRPERAERKKWNPAERT